MLPRLSPRRKNGFAGEGARALPQVRPLYSKRWISGDDAWVFVTAEGTSICWSVSGRLPLFRQANKLQHEMHYLAPLRQLSRQSDFLRVSVCLLLFLLCVGVRCPQGTARWTSRSSWRYLGPNFCRPTTEKDSWATPSTTSSGRWETKRVSHRSQSSVPFISSIPHASSHLLWLCVSAVVLKHRPRFCRDSTHLLKCQNAHMHKNPLSDPPHVSPAPSQKQLFFPFALKGNKICWELSVFSLHGVNVCIWVQVLVCVYHSQCCRRYYHNKDAGMCPCMWKSLSLNAFKCPNWAQRWLFCSSSTCFWTPFFCFVF